MRTSKMFIGAMAILSVTACQNEEWVNESQNPTDRPQVEVTVAASKLGFNGANTRYVYENGIFDFATGDALGVCLVDPAGTLTDDKHAGNSKFVRQENKEFTSPSTISVGKQLFYFPYDEKNTTSRNGVIVKKLGVQQYDATGEQMAVNDFLVSPVVDLSGYEAGAIQLPIKMWSIYGYGKVIIKNNTNKPFEIQKIVIASNEKFVLGGKLQPAEVTKDTGLPKLIVDLKGKTTTEEISAAFDAANAVYDDPADPSKRTVANWVTAEDADKGSVAVNFLKETTGMTLAVGEELTTRVLIPAGSYAKANFKVTVYTSSGEQEFAASTDGVVATTGENVQISNSRIKTITATVTKLEALEAKTITVISNNDLIASLKQFAGTEDAEVTVTATDPLTIDKGVLAQVPSNVTLKFAESSNITFDGDMNLKKVKFTAKASGTASTVTLKNGTFAVSDFTLGASNNLVLEGAHVTFGDKAVGGGSSSVTVKTGATLNAPTQFVANMDVQGGELNIGAAAKLKAAVEPISLYLRNVTAGTVNINVPVKLNGAFVIGNEESKESKTDATLNVNAAITLVNKATLTINKDGKANLAASVTTIADNKGVITATAGTATITANNGSVEVAEAAKITVTTNNGTIDNNAEVQGGGTLEVGTHAATGIINTVKDSQTDITITLLGKVYYTKGAFINVPAGFVGSKTEAGNVIFTISADMTAAELINEFSGSNCTALYVKDATLTFEKGTTDKQIEELADLKVITFEGAKAVVDAAVGFYNCPIYVYGNVTVSGASTLAFSKKENDIIYVQEAAKFDVSVPISKLTKVTIAKDGRVIARKRISGTTAVDGEGSANWNGIKYEVIAQNN